jgi:hypothetical protein
MLARRLLQIARTLAHTSVRTFAVDVGKGAYVNKAQLKVRFGVANKAFVPLAVRSGGSLLAQLILAQGMVTKDGLAQALEHDLSKYAQPLKGSFPPPRAALERARCESLCCRSQPFAPWIMKHTCCFQSCMSKLVQAGRRADRGVLARRVRWRRVCV